MRMTATKYCFLILIANSFLFLIAWGVANANEDVESDKLQRTPIENVISK